MKLSHILKFHWGAKDGGAESRVWCYGIESKLLGSLLVLRFAQGSREAFHNHAFNAVSWVMLGALLEEIFLAPGAFGPDVRLQHYPASFVPIFTSRNRFHKVTGLAPSSWVITVRGPWRAIWLEFLPLAGRYIRLTHGRKEVTA